MILISWLFRGHLGVVVALPCALDFQFDERQWAKANQANDDWKRWETLDTSGASGRVIPEVSESTSSSTPSRLSLIYIGAMNLTNVSVSL